MTFTVPEAKRVPSSKPQGWTRDGSPGGDSISPGAAPSWSPRSWGPETPTGGDKPRKDSQGRMSLLFLPRPLVAVGTSELTPVHSDFCSRDC